jgi:hypothetical protein
MFFDYMLWIDSPREKSTILLEERNSSCKVFVFVESDGALRLNSSMQLLDK